MSEYNLSDLVITKIYSISTIYTKKNANKKRIQRSNWCIGIKHEGETQYTNNRKIYISNINNIIVMPKGCSYDWICTKSGHFSMIEFECEKICDALMTFSIKNGESLLIKVRKLEYMRIEKEPTYEIECISETYSIILSLLKTVSKKYLPTDKQLKIKPAVDYINQNYFKPVNNESLSSLTGLSTVYFRKLFAEIYGMPPITYIHTLRIRKAKEMLHSDFGNISEIAQSVGYSNIYDFSRTFKNHVGVSPIKYLKSNYKK